MTSLPPFVVDADHLSAALAAAAKLVKTDDFAFKPHHAYVNSYVAVRAEKSNISKRTSTLTRKPVIAPTPCHIDEEEERHDYNEDAEQRVARSRERNREHARRTRLRKKAQLEALQSKVKGLQAESTVLKQSLEECSIASILVGIASGKTNEMIEDLVNEVSGDNEQDILRLVGGKRKRFISDASEKIPQALSIKIDGRTAIIGGGRTHINWKSGVYSDENGNQTQLSRKDLESLRRERNRMHAKMTRDRKKNFISAIEETIEKLETNNNRMKKILEDFIKLRLKSNVIDADVTPLSSPQSMAMSSSPDRIPTLDLTDDGYSPAKRMRIDT